MTVLQAIILGIIQGITEFLPVSSSGHLLVIPRFFDWGVQGLDFDVAVHIATLGAILVALRADVMRMLRTPRLLALVGLGTVPVVAFGLFMPDSLLLGLRTPLFVSVSLIFWGIVLIVADGIARHHRSLPALFRIQWGKAFFIGCAQVIALIPGTSRSGVTMSAGMLSGLSREDAARFAFLLAIPAIAGAGLLTFIDAMQVGFSTSFDVLLSGMIAAFVSGLLAIRLLLIVAQKAGFLWFGVYRIVLAGLIILFIL